MSKQKANSSLLTAKINKNDEFYTTLETIEAELQHYQDKFKDKIIYLNCDNYKYSNFYKYFDHNFIKLGLKKLIATHYSSQEESIKMEILYIDKEKTYQSTILKGDGDFESNECMEFLLHSDIIITNPPFSKFRAFFNALKTHNKAFLIIGSINASIYKECFLALKNNKIWLGVNYGAMNFIDVVNEGLVKFGNISWYTNIDHAHRHQLLNIDKLYNSEHYPTYDNFNAINVNKIKDIPIFNGVMGVPISFLHKYNADQFEIVGLGNGAIFLTLDGAKGLSDEFLSNYFQLGKTGNYGKTHLGLGYYKNGIPIIPYTRILIQKHHPAANK